MRRSASLSITGPVCVTASLRQCDTVSLYTVSLYTVSLYTVSLYTVSLYTVSLYTVSLYCIAVPRVTRSGTVLGNPIRNVETISISQQAQAIGHGARFLCQFLVGEEPLSTVVPQLKQVSRASTQVGNISSVRRQMLSQYTEAVRAVVANDPTLNRLVSSTENQPQFAKLQNVVSSHANLTSPAITGSLNLLESYASISSTALDTTVTVKGLSNAISLGNIFSSMRAKAKGKIGTLANTVTVAVNAISMYSEQV